MSKINVKPKNPRLMPNVRLAGGMGMPAARQDAEALLRRAVMTCLLWEDMAYETGQANAANIAALVPQVAPPVCAQIALEARTQQKLRHVPLFIAREMARHPTHRGELGALLPRICTRADQISDFLALYWKAGKQPLANQVKKGLAAALRGQSGYALAKYNRPNTVKLRDVLFMTHPQPGTDLQKGVFDQLASNTLASPDTWEVELSAGKDKRVTWERLIAEEKLGALAFLRNLRNMQEAQVSYPVLQRGFGQLAQTGQLLLPLNFLAAQKAAPNLSREIEGAMLACYARLPKLPGWSVLVLDVSGSMHAPVSSKSDFKRMEAGAALMMLASEQAERVSLYLTAGGSAHKTARVASLRGFGLLTEIRRQEGEMGGGGIFTRQMLDWVKDDLKGAQPDRMIVFSDSQDCDRSSAMPKPFGTRNYIADVSAHAHGVNFQGVWTAEVAGWSEHLLTFIAALEGQTLAEGAEG